MEAQSVTKYEKRLALIKKFDRKVIKFLLLNPDHKKQ